MISILKFIGVFLGLNLILYLMGSFIALSFNPNNWIIYELTIGRILILIIEGFLLWCTPDIIDEFL